MNKTYKVIYNRTRCMYQVVSELAKGHTKSETPEMLKNLFSKHSGLTRGIVMAVLSMSLAMPVGIAVQADGTAGTSGDTTSTSNTTTSDATDTTTTGTNVKVKEGATLVGSGAVSVSSSTDTIKNTTTITIAVPTDGKVEANNTGLVTGGTVYTAVNSEQTAREAADTTLTNKIGTLDANGKYNYIQKDASVSSNLSTLDTQVKTNADAISKEKTDREAAVTGITNTVNSLSDSAVKYDADSNKTKVTLAGKGGTTITNIKEGALSDSSMDAVTGKQLYAEQTARESADTTLTNKIGSLSANGNYIQMNASVSSNFSTLDTQVKTNADAISKERTDRTDAISALKTELTSDSTNSSLASKANVNASNIGKNIDTSSETTDEAKTKKQKENATLWGEALGLGAIEKGDSMLISGGTLYSELRPSADGTYSYISNANTTAVNLIHLDSALNALGVEMLVDSNGNPVQYTSTLYKYFKVNPEVTSNEDGTKTYATDAAANGINSVAIGPNAKTATYTTTVTSGDTVTTTETAADHAVAIGEGATVNAAGDQGIALGNGAVTGEAETTTSDGTTTTTTDAKGGESSVAIGDTAKANGNQALAFGKGASVLNPSGIAVSTGSTAIGSGAKVDGGDNSIALGTKATVNTVSDAMALGNGATINKTATGSIAFGKSAVTGGVDKPIALTNGTTGTLAAAGGVDSIAIGNGAVSEGNEALALGKGAKVTNGATSGDSAAAIVKTGSAAIGDGATVANSENSMAIGKGASITEGIDTTVIGSGANASQTKQAFVAGYQASADSSAESSVAIGDNASTHSARTTAIGYKAEAHNADSIAIGSEAKTDDNGGGIAIGTSASVAYGGLAFGKKAEAKNDDSLAIGNGAVADVNKSISIGYNAGVGTAEDNKEKNGSLVAIGTSAGNNVKGMQNVAIGASAGSSVLSSNNIAIGTNAGYGIKNVTSATDTNPQNGYNISIGAGANYTEGNTNQNIVSSIAIGHATHAVNRAVALGEGASAQGDSGMALGNSATSSGSGSIAIGNTASASNGNIALGAGAIATGTPTGTGKWTNTAAPSYYISVGGKGNGSDSTITLRRISNVADGSADQDVVTVKQLQKVSDDLENTIKGIDTSQLKTYSTTEIDNKIAEVNQNIKDSGVKYFSINSASQSTNSNNTGANGDGDADAMAIGPNAKASSVKALAIGNNVSASGTLSIAIGTANNPSTDTTTADNPHPTSSEGTSSVAIGTSAIAQTDNSIAIGTRATTYTANTTSSPVTKVGIQSIAIGYGAETRDNNAIAFGTTAKANSTDSIAVGYNAQALNERAIVIGSSTAYGSNSVTIGLGNTNNGAGVLTTGNSNEVTNSQGSTDVVKNSGIYGSSNKIHSVTTSNSGNAITDVSLVGNGNELNQNGEMNVLNDVSVLGNKNVIENGTAGAYTQTVKQIAVVGSGNTVKGNTQVDYNTWGTVQRDTILGYKNTVDATNQSTPVSNLQILGNDVTATFGNSVYLGTGSSATASKSATAEAIKLAKDQGDTEAFASDEYKNAATDEAKNAIKQKYEAKYIHAANIAAMDKDGTSAGVTNYDTDYTYGNDSTYNYAGSQADGVVTVGSKDATRRIQNVSAGLVGPNSTDAVNGSQLYALTRQIRFGGDNSSFGNTAAGDTNVVARGSNEKISITGGSDAVTSSTTDGTTTYTVDATKLTGNNIAVVTNTDTNALHVQLASNLKNLNTASLGSGSGDSYKETIKLDGTDTTNGGTLTLDDASGKNGVTLRTSGTTTTKDATGAATTRLLVNDKTIATTDDGLIVAGDSGTNSVLKLNSTLTVKGGINSTNAANRLNDDNNNIGVTSNGKGNLTVKLSKDIALGNYQSGTESADKSGTLRINGGSYYSLDNGSALSFYKSAGTANGSSKSPAEGDKLMATLGIYQGGYLGLYDSNGANEEMLYNGGTTNGIHRLTYKDIANNKTYDLATLNDYTNFKDDAGHSVSIALDKSLTLKGGASTTDVENADKWTTGNISIVSSADTDNGTANGNGTMTIRLAKNLNLGTDGSVVTGATTINNSGLTNGSTTLNGTGLTIANGSSITTSGIAANGKITSVTAGEANTDAANVGQVKAATSEVANAGANVNSVTRSEGNNGQTIYTVNVDNLAVKVTDGRTVKGTTSVALKDGLVFADGTNTTATVGDNGTIKFNVSNDAIRKQAVQAITVQSGSNVTVTPATNADGTLKTFTVAASDLKYSANGTSKTTSLANGISFASGSNTTAEIDNNGAIKINATHNKLNAIGAVTKATADNNAVTLTLQDADGNTTTAGLTDTYTTVSKDADNKKVTFKRNDGETQTLELSDLGGITAAQDKYVTSGTVTYDANGNGTAALTGNNGLTASITGLKDTKVSSGTTTYVGTQGNATGSATLTMNDGSTATISGLQDDYITSAAVGTETNHVTMTRLGGGTVDLNLNPILEKYSLSDYRLVGNGDTQDQAYQVSADGTVTLNVVDAKNAANKKTIQITGLASQSGVNAGRTTVKSSDNSVIVNDGTSNSNTHTYDIKVDYSKIPANLTVKYSGDNGTTGSNTMDKATAFSGTANQIVTKAENGKVSFKLADNISGIQSVTTGDSRMDTNGLAITGGPSVLKIGINAGGKTISNVADAAQDTDAATLKQVKNARTKVVAGDNVNGVTSSEATDGSHQKTYTVNVDNLSVKANDGTPKGVALKTGLNFKNGANTTAYVGDNGEVKYDLNSTLTGLTSVTAGNSTLDTNGLTIKKGTATKVAITSDNVTMGGNVIQNVGDGIAPTDAVNKKQLDDLQTQVSGGWNLTGKNSDGTAVTAKIGAGKKVTYVDGNYTKSVVTKDDSTGNATDATVKVDVTTGTFGSDAGKATSAADGLATTKDVANAINSASISVVADNTPKNKTAVKAGDTIHFAKDKNLTLTQDGTTFTYGLTPEISISKVTTSDATKGSTVQTAEGVTTTDAAGNTYIQNGQGITLTPSDNTKFPVKLTNTGLDNGGNKITGVGKGTDDTDAVNVAQLKEVNDKVGSGWQIAGNDGQKVTDIGAGKKVAFKSNSNYLTTSTIARSATGELDTGADVTYSLKTAALASGTDGTVTAVADANDGLVTAKNLATVLNSTYWSAAADASGSGTVSGNAAAASIKAGTKVTFTAGDNMSLTQNGAQFTYALLPNLTNMNTIRFGGGLLIGNQAGSGANTEEGNYITGLSNTKWDRAKISENSNMAATEGQLKQAIENITTSGGGTGGFGLQADTGDSIMQDLRKTIQIKGDGEGTQDGNIKTSNEGGVLHIRLNKKLNLTDQGSVTIGSSNVSDGRIVLDNTDAAKKITLNSNEGTAAIGGVTVNGAASTVSGLSNTEWNVETAAANGYKGSNKAATESQLQTVYNQATKTASENELHTLAKEGGYTVDDNHKVSMDVVNGKGDKQGSIVINDVAKASEVGTVSEIADDLKTKNGDTVQSTSVVEAINNLNDKVGDKKYSTVQGKELADGDSATTAIGKLNNRMNDIYTTAGQHSSVSKADDNLTISENKNASGGTDYKIGLNKEQINLGNLIIKGNEGSISAKSMTSDSFTAGDTVVNKDGVKVGDKSALTGDSLKVNGKTYVDDKGVNANGQVIRNVGEGKEDGDAVNVKQVNDLAARQGEAIEQNTAHINQLGQAVNKLGNRLNRVGAGAAALAALHPGTYDPNDKWDFSAGVGHYHDANAVAIGAYYHPNDTTILSIGGSMGGGENMVNAGITWKMGRSGREQAAQPVVVRKVEAAPVVQQVAPVRPAPVVTPAPVTIPTPVKSVTSTMPVHAVPAVTTPMTPAAPSNDTAALAQILARQTAILEKLAQNQAQAVPSAAVAHGDDIFPDVPDNHWAYAYVAKLEKAGALKGFKRPAVLKSPMMTRDDFASVLYTAMANGATTNPALNGDDSLNRLAQEFKAELKNVKV